jgi:hypothetical protein
MRGLANVVATSLAGVASFAVGCASHGTGGRAPAPATVVTPARQAPPPAPDSVTAERQRYVAALRASISGRENMPAESVFKNVRVMKLVPAGRLLAIMDIGYGRSLGVSCTHCHVPDKWDLEDKPQKQIAREMSAMAGTINRELLPKIKNLKSEQPIVNCTTCHRGATKPALDLPGPAKD